MVYITEGVSLRIPAGGLKITLDGSAPPTVKLEVRLDTWQHWLRIALRHTDAAEAAHALLVQAVGLNDDPAKGAALEAEFNAAMLGICAAAFSLDAFYASIKEYTPRDTNLEAAWRHNRTKRSARIVETIRTGFSVRNDTVRELKRRMDDVFRFRDWGVHPPAAFQEPLRHPDLGLGVEWRFITFSAANCRAIAGFALSVIAQAVRKPKPRLTALSQWCTSAEQITKPLVDEWTQKYGALF